MEKQEKTATGSPVLQDNIFLRKVTNEVEHTKQLSEDALSQLKKIFSRKNFKGIEKCSYELVIALGLSGNQELRILANEFNGILNNFCK